MDTKLIENKATKAYSILIAFIICGFAVSTVTASKVVHIGINFPFSNIIFSVFSYPLIDCVCELWGKKIALQTIWLALCSQLLVVLLLQLSIIAPAAPFWHEQNAYMQILSSGLRVLLASVSAFFFSQMLDVFIYQKIKRLFRGKLLWLRSNVSTIIGQAIDSSIFITVVFYASTNKWDIFIGSIMVKFIISILMTPVVYLIVIGIDNYLESHTKAFAADVTS